MKTSFTVLLLLSGLTCWPTLGQERAKHFLYTSTVEQNLLKQFFQGKQVDTLSLLFAIGNDTDTADSKELHEAVDKLLLKIARKHASPDIRLLRYLASQAYAKLLLRYEPEVSFKYTMSQGYFDCVTGSLFFAYLLEHFGFDYRIHETNYHVYLTVHLPEGPVLIETTERAQGFLTNEAAIAKRVQEYAEANTAYDEQSLYRELDLVIDQVTDFRGLVGLLYFNEAVKLFNKQQYQHAHEQLAKSMLLYQNPRSVALLNLTQQQLFSASSTTLR